MQSEVKSSPPFLHKNIDVIGGGIFGISLFCVLYGWTWLNPFNWEWCLAEEDAAQHFLGGMFFCKDAWHWPLGLFYGINGDSPHLISFVDGIPLAAFLAKLCCKVFSVKGIFQYLGITYLVNFMLQGILAALLMRKASPKIALRFYGTVMMTAAPCLLLEVPGHCALTSQWLILWALLLCVSDAETSHFCQWSLLLALSLLIHPYFTGICSVLGIACFLQRFDRSEIRKYILNAAVFVLVFGFLAYLQGYFSVAICPGGGSAFANSVNLNGFFNSHDPRYSSLICPLPRSPLNACVYAGAGYILLALVGMPMLCRHCGKKSVQEKYGVILFSLFACWLFALGNHVFFGSQIIFSVILPPWLLRICSVFRANGRFFWPVWYFLMFGLWFVVGIWEKKRLAAVVAGTVFFLQCVDFCGGLLGHTWARYFERNGIGTVWATQDIPSCVSERKISRVVYEYPGVSFIAPSLLALKCGCGVNTFYYARQVESSDVADPIVSLWKNGPLKAHLYVLTGSQKRKLLDIFPALSDRIVPYKEFFLLLPES